MNIIKTQSKLMRTALFFLGISLMVMSCKKDKDNDEGGDENTATVEGKIFNENGTVAIPAVKVYVDVNGKVFLTTSKKDGSFSLDIPEGTHTLYMQAGEGDIFFNTTEITVKKGDKTNLSAGSTVLKQSSNLAYISGTYDDIESIIIDSLGYQADELTAQDLLSPSTLSDYAAIFLNCGLQDQLEGQMYQNLEDFVSNGGSLYASDFAVEYLTGDGNMKSGTFSEHHDNHDHFNVAKSCNTQLGGFVTDNILCTQKQGTSGVYSVDVVDPDIQTAVGSNTMNVDYDLGAWEVIKNLGPEFDVLVEDPSNYGPLAVQSNSSAPWSNGNGGNQTIDDIEGNFVTICHIPPGNPNNPQTITISVNALQAHLNHGCSIGSCEGNGGKILYTTFHNHPQGNINNDTYNILQYFIMNL